MRAASAMDRQGLPVSVGTGVYSNTTAFFASLRMSDSAQRQALAELLSVFVRQTHQPTSALDKHNPDALWDAPRLLLENSPVRAAYLARLRADGCGGEKTAAAVEAAAVVAGAL